MIAHTFPLSISTRLGCVRSTRTFNLRVRLVYDDRLRYTPRSRYSDSYRFDSRYMKIHLFMIRFRMLHTLRGIDKGTPLLLQKGFRSRACDKLIYSPRSFRRHTCDRYSMIRLDFEILKSNKDLGDPLRP